MQSYKYKPGQIITIPAIALGAFLLLAVSVPVSTWSDSKSRLAAEVSFDDLLDDSSADERDLPGICNTLAALHVTFAAPVAFGLRDFPTTNAYTVLRRARGPPQA
jgi:hypothetical protein